MFKLFIKIYWAIWITDAYTFREAYIITITAKSIILKRINKSLSSKILLYELISEINMKFNSILKIF